jgi:predicted dehydrogenase
LSKIRVCLVGFGYWGPNLARNISSSKDFELNYIVESDLDKHEKIQKLYPKVKILSGIDKIQEVYDLIDVGVIATPTSTHFQLVKAFLNIDCHVWVEKPFTKDVLESEELLVIAEQKDLKIFVDHTYLYTTAVATMKSLMSEIGEITYISSTRSNFGIIQRDSSVIWDLAVHDLSIAQYLVSANPINVIAKATTPFRGIQDSVATLIIEFDSFNFIIHVNWLSPFKVRDFILGGTAKTLYFNDTKTDDKIRVYSQSIEDLPKFGKTDIRLYDYKYGDIFIPDVANDEALANAFGEFAKYILEGVEPPSSGKKALAIIKILAAAEESIQRNGEQVKIDYEFKET